AARIAQGARTALRESQRERRQLAVNVPTWTGASGRAGVPAAAVAPPPSAVLDGRVPEALPELQAVSRTRRKPLPASAPSTRTVGGPGLLSVARAPPSASILAGLRAQQPDPPRRSNLPGPAATSPARPAEQRPRRTVHPLSPRPPRAPTPTRTAARSAAVSDRRPRDLSDADKRIVARIRAELVQNGGQLGNKQLMDALDARLDDVPRLRQLASTVADLVSIPQRMNRAGMGRIVQKVWRLKS
ncbi:hypothetical protein LPJ70_004247, partial [Coemansia sp. RSA 2708]